MDVNFHQANMTLLQKEKEFLLEVAQDGDTKINNADLKVFVHSLGEGTKNSQQILTVSDVLFPDKSQYSIVHPTLHANVVDVNTLRDKSYQYNTRHKDCGRFFKANDEQKTLFNWLEQFNNIDLRTTKQITELATKIQMTGISFKVADDFLTVYATFKKEFQKKFNIFFSILDGNHRSTVLAKLLDREPFSDRYIRQMNDMPVKLTDVKARVFDLFTVNIEFHDKQLIDSKYARQESYNIRATQQKTFGLKFIDYFSTFLKRIKSKHDLVECDDSNFFSSSYGKDIKDVFVENLEKSLSEIVCIVVSFSENKGKHDEILREMKRKPAFKEYYCLSKQARRNIQIGNISLPEESVLIMDLMRLFCSKLSLISKFNYFLRNPCEIDRLQNDTIYKSNFENTQVFKILLSSIYRMSNFLHEGVMSELEHVSGKSDVRNNFPTRRLVTMMQISILEEIIDVWKMIGNDPRVYLNTVKQYGSMYLRKKVKKILEQNEKEKDPLPILVLLLLEYENNHRAYLNYIKNSQDIFIFDEELRNKILDTFTSNRTKKGATLPQNLWKCNQLRLRDVFDSFDNVHIFIPCSFKTFMSLYFPCLFSSDDIASMKSYYGICFPQVILFCKQRYKRIQDSSRLCLGRICNSSVSRI